MQPDSNSSNQIPDVTNYDSDSLDMLPTQTQAPVNQPNLVQNNGADPTNVINASSNNQNFIKPRKRSPFRRFNKLSFIITGAVLLFTILSVVGGLYFASSPTGQNSKNSKPKANDFSVSSLKISNVIPNQDLQLSPSEELDVNGQLKVNNNIVLMPTAQPSDAVTGELYYNQINNQPYYYNGEQFISLGSKGVTSVQGQNGAINFSSGVGITLNGTQILNSGVTNLNGTNNQIQASQSTGSITLSLPQDIAPGSSPSFSGITTPTIEARTNDSGLTVGSLTQALDLQGSDTTLTDSNNGNTTEVVFDTPTGNNVLTLPDVSGEICTSDNNCHLQPVGTYIDLQASTPGTAQAGNFNISGTAVVGTLISNDIQSSSEEISGQLSAGSASIANGIAADNATITNTVTAGSFSGDGTNVTNVNAAELAGQQPSYYLNASNINTGTLSDDRLSPNVVLANGNNNLSGNNTFTGGNTFSGNLTSTGNNSFSGANNFTSDYNSFTGDGSNLINLNASVITNGTLADGRLSPDVTLASNQFNGSSELIELTSTGVIPTLSGINLTNLNASDVASGTLADARLSTDVTLQGNSFNGANQLVQLDTNGDLPAVSGAALLDLNGSAVSSGSVAVAYGGTGAISASGARTNLQAAQSGSNSDITSLLDLTEITPNNALTIGSNIENLSLQGATTSLSDMQNGYTSTLGFTTPSANNVIVLPDASGTVCLSSGNCSAIGSGYANLSLSNLSSVAINTNLLPGSADAVNLGSSSLPFGTISLSDGGSYSYTLSGTSTTSNKNIILPTFAGSTATLCLTTGNCAGAGGGVTTGGGTANTIALFNAGQQIGNSIISQDSGATTITVGGQLYVTGSSNLAGQLSANGGIVTNNTNINAGTGLITGDGSNLTNLNGSNVTSGTIADNRLSTNVTLQGNDFNGDNQLVQLTSTGILPVVSGVNLTNLNGSNVTSGTIADNRLSTNVALLSQTNQLFTGSNIFQPTVGNDSVNFFRIQNAAGNMTLFDADTTDNRIGIDTATPEYTLDVAGQVNSSVGFSVNGVAVCTVTACASASGSGSYIQNGTTPETGNFNIKSSSSNAVGGVIEGTSGQTADIFDVRNSSNTNLFSVSANGTVTSTNNFVVGGSSSLTGNVNANGSATFEDSTNSTTAFQVQNATGGSVLTADTNTNSLTVNQGNLTVSGLSNVSTPTVSTSTSSGSLAPSNYYYQVAATNANGNTTATLASPYPQFTTGTTSTNTVSWSAVPNATGYIVYRSTNGTTWYANSVTSTSIVDNGSNYIWSTVTPLPTTNGTGGSFTASGNLAVSGTSTLTGILTANGGINSVGNLTQTGNSNLTGATNINTSGSSATSIGNANSATTIGGGLAVGGATTLTGNTTESGALVIQGSGGLTLGVAGITSGKLAIANSGTSYTVSIQGSNLQANALALNIPTDASTTDTLCLQNLNNCNGANAVTTVGTLDGATANANGATITNNTFYLQSASANYPGLVNTTTQIFAGAKTFSGNLAVTGSSSINVGSGGISTTGGVNAYNLGLNGTAAAINFFTPSASGGYSSKDVYVSGTANIGDVVVTTGLSGNNQQASTTTIPRDPRVYGIAENAVTNGSSQIATSGNSTVNVGTGAVNIGDQLVTSSVAGQAMTDNNATNGIIGYALSSKAAGSAGTVSIEIRPVNGVSTPNFRPTTDSTTAFQIQNASGSKLFQVDSTDTAIGIAGASTTAGYALNVTGSVNASGNVYSNGVQLCTVTACASSSANGNYIQNGTTTQAASFNIQGASTTSTVAVLEENSSGTGDILDLENGTGAIVSSVSSTGNELVKPSTNSTTAFQVQNADGYSVLTTATFAELSSPTAPTLTTTTTGGALTAGTYYYKLAAMNANGTTMPVASNPASITTTGSTSTNTLTWTTDTGATGYLIYRSINGTLWSPCLTALTSSATSFSDVGNDCYNSTTLPTVNTTAGSLNVNGVIQIGGINALQVTSFNNLFLGQAGNNTTQGQFNNGIGEYSLSNLTTGYGNEAIGYYTLKADSTGTDNVAIGDSSSNNLNGSGDVALGANSLSVATSVSNDVAIGNNALKSATGGSNVGVGASSLTAVTGNYDTALGNSSGYADTSGIYDTYLGSFSGYTSNLQVNYSTALGNDSVVSQSSTIALGCTSGINNCTATTSVAIGTAGYAPNLLSVGDQTYGTYGTAGTTTTITQSTTAITGSGTNFTSSMNGGTIYYSDGTTGTVTYVSATSLTSSVSKTVAAGSTYTIVYGGFNVISNGTEYLQPATNSTTAFQIQNASGSKLFQVDSTDTAIGIAGASTTAGYALNVTGSVNASGNVYSNGVQLCTVTACASSSANGNYIQNGTTTQAASFNIQGASTTSTVAVLEENSSGTGDILDLENGTGAIVSSVSSTGNELVKPSTNSTTAFQVQNASGSSVLTANTSTNSVTINQGNLTVQGISNTVAPTLTTASSGGSLAAATYYYELAATNANGTTTAVASSPTNVTTTGTASFNTLSWTATTNATGYVIYRSTNGTTWYSNAVSSSTTSLIDNGSTYSWGTSATLPTTNTTGGSLNVSGSATITGTGSSSSNELSVINSAGSTVLTVSGYGVLTTSSATISGSVTTPLVICTALQANVCNTQHQAIATTTVSTGDVVIFAGTNNPSSLTGQTQAGDTTIPRDSRVYGVAVGSAVSGGLFNVAITGATTINVGAGAVSMGDQLVTSSVAGQAVVDNTATTGIIGYATSTKSAGSSGTVGIRLASTSTSSTPDFRPTTDSTTAFQIQNSASTTTLFDADTVNGRIGIGTNAPGNLLSIGALTTASSGAQIAVSTGGATNSGIVVQTVAGQSSGYVFQAQNSSGTLLAGIDYQGNLTVKNGTFIGTLSINGHVITGNTNGTTTATVNANAGTGATCTVSGNDTGGQITVTTGSGSWASGDQCDVTFASSYGSAPHPVIARANATSTSVVQPYVTSTITNFSLNFTSPDVSSNTYVFNYFNAQ
jgi:hypothetical protein